MPSDKTKNEHPTSEKTRMSEEEDYEAHSGALPSTSVYDFLYQDVRRVGSFLAQFDEYGVRQSVKATESVGQTQTLRGAAVGTIGLPAVLGASANIDTATADETKDIAEHTFDPLWANSRRLLDYLYEHDLIEQDLWAAALGRFVLIEGSVSIVDGNTITPVLKNPELFEMMLLKGCEENGVSVDSPAGKELRQSLVMITDMPKAIHLYIYKDGSNAWATIMPESLVTSAHDLAFKHGALVRGHWRVLGIIDAWPDQRNDPTEEEPDPKTLDELGANALPDGLVKIAANLANISRNLLGRPRTHFGITPVLIFREVSGQINS